MVVIYSEENCTACVGVKNLLANNGVEFEERRIDKDDKYLEEVKEMGYSAVPVTVTPSGEEILGFDLPKLQKLIKENK